MYMAGLFRTASSPSRTCILLAEYSAAFFSFSAVISIDYKGSKIRILRVKTAFLPGIGQLFLTNFIPRFEASSIEDFKAIFDHEKGTFLPPFFDRRFACILPAAIARFWQPR